MLLLKAKPTVPLENKNTDDTMNIILLLLSAFLLQTRQPVGPWIKSEVKKTFSFLDLYSFMLWNGLGSGFGSHLRIFPFASSISKHSRDLVFSLMWEPSDAAALSCWWKWNHHLHREVHWSLRQGSRQPDTGKWWHSSGDLWVKKVEYLHIL